MFDFSIQTLLKMGKLRSLSISLLISTAAKSSYVSRDNSLLFLIIVPKVVIPFSSHKKIETIALIDYPHFQIIENVNNISNIKYNLTFILGYHIMNVTI